MTTIPLICHNCGVTHILTRTQEIPDSAVVIHSNMCIACMEETDPFQYEEWYSDEPLPEPEDPNQLKLEL